MTEALFSPVKLGALELSNRIIMAPMTRDRAGPGDVPTPAMIEYYRQRASAGLIITEGVQPNASGKGYWRTPGIWSEEQAAGWAKVAEAVHAEGGKIVIQLMHCGRVVVPANRGYDADIVAPSAIPCPEKVPGPDGVPAETAMPRALEPLDHPAIAAEFSWAARNALLAGIDGLELHCASGYLINQYLNPASNHRSDDFGGTPEKQVVFPAMVLAALAGTMGADRVGFRISPGNPFNGMDVRNPAPNVIPLLKAANALGLAYAHVMDMSLPDFDALALVKAHYSGPVITNNGLNPDQAAEIIASGRADAVSFGRAFVANPDLHARIRAGAALAEPDYAYLYIGEEKGYTDYPAMGG